MLKIITGCWYLPKKLLRLVVCVALLGALSACFSEDETQQNFTDKPTVTLKKLSFSNLNGWNDDDFAFIIPVFRKNCSYIMQLKNEFIYSSAIKINTKDYQKVCERFLYKDIQSGKEMKKFIESEFVPYAVSDRKNEIGQFTSYYEATIHASFEKSDEYKYPVYGRPSDLIEINLKEFDSSLPNTRLVGRVENNKFVPYYKRKEIEENGINAPVLMWGNDLVDIHFMQIQGSAIAVMDDGSEIRIGYADSNGRKFKGIGSILLQKGLIKSGEASMPKIREWLRKNPQKAVAQLAENERFIFQRLVDSDGPVGAMGVSLTGGRSLAVDNKYIPLGALMWLETYSPDNDKIQKVVFAQDIGSAIKGVVRGDYFWGHGEEALQEAGRMNSRGSYYLLAPKNSDVKVENVN